jgi:hypothetical protein
MTPRQTATELRVAPMEWLRGPAKLDDGWIELDRERARRYTPFAEAGLMYDLAAIRRPPDALAFVQRYGLLHHGPDAQDSRERFADFESAALELSNTIGIYNLIRRAVRGEQDSGDAMSQLWDLAPQLAEGFDGEAKSADELVDQATQLVTYWTNQGLRGVDFKVVPSAHWGGQVGDFSLSAHTPTLLGSAYQQLAQAIVGRMPMRSCPECGRYFVFKDKRQRFCSATCGSRARQRRFAERQQEDS